METTTAPVNGTAETRVRWMSPVFRCKTGINIRCPPLSAVAFEAIAENVGGGEMHKAKKNPHFKGLTGVDTFDPKNRLKC